MKFRPSSLTRILIILFTSVCSFTQSFGFVDEATEPIVANDQELQIEKLNAELIESLTRPL